MESLLKVEAIPGVESASVARIAPVSGNSSVRNLLIEGCAGSALGLFGAYLATRAITSVLYGVSATDPLTFGLVSLLLVGVALIACYVPARRARKVEPLISLRSE